MRLYTCKVMVNYLLLHACIDEDACELKIREMDLKRSMQYTLKVNLHRLIKKQRYWSIATVNVCCLYGLLAIVSLLSTIHSIAYSCSYSNPKKTGAILLRSLCKVLSRICNNCSSKYSKKGTVKNTVLQGIRKCVKLSFACCFSLLHCTRIDMTIDY